MTTTCLRSLKLQLHPKFFIKRIGSSSQIGLPRTHACNQFENADSRNQCQSAELSNYNECRIAVRSTSLAPTGSLMVLGLLDRLAPLDLACYDNFNSMVPMQRLSESCDSLGPRVGSTGVGGTTEISRHLYEEDLEHHTVMRNGDHLSMAVLMDSLPVALSAQIADVRQQCAPLTEYERSMILSSDAKQSQTSGGGGGQPSTGDPTAKPTDDQLERIYLKLGEMVATQQLIESMTRLLEDSLNMIRNITLVPYFFTKPQDYTIFHNNLVFQNNIRGATTHGLPAYIQQMALLRLLGHLKFAFVKMEVLKVTKHPEDGTVRIRWRIRGISGLRVLLLFWKYKLWNFRDIMQKQTDWYDGFSTFYVGGDGLVHKHVCDKMMPDDHKEKSSSTPNLAAKLALMLGAIPQPSLEDLDAICMALEQTPK